MDYTVIGDAVNSGARLEGLIRKHGCRILLTETTLGQVRPLLDAGKLGHLTVRWVERAVVKGKAKPLEVFELHTVAPGTRSGVTEDRRSEQVATGACGAHHGLVEGGADAS